MNQETEPAGSSHPPEIRSCKSCSHVQVCVIFRAVEGMLNSYFPEAHPPFKADELACVCRHYCSVYIRAYTDAGFGFHEWRS